MLFLVAFTLINLKEAIFCSYYTFSVIQKHFKHIHNGSKLIITKTAVEGHDNRYCLLKDKKMSSLKSRKQKIYEI